VTDPVELSIYIEASPTTVFPFFTDSERMCRWMGVAADIDARPGGALRIDVTGRDVAAGTIVEVVPSERIVFTWGWEGSAGMPPGTSTIEVTLAREGDGTLLRLRHYDLRTTAPPSATTRAGVTISASRHRSRGRRSRVDDYVSS
jgi:uncharacterized protein YndB with AHSA1/START domain